ncbi:peroxiredoxin [Pseudomonas cucumis]|uniref:Peroxiredoxin n=1 Tax=Pseudomonas cucumis TaxID=2954082 RepID=A0ABY9F0Y4_9PSED|nr:peroxiredoxin [Pseudomonas cucumis]WLG86276.1 peroxiredoxin [Pseudomonas cucumis]
MTDQQPNPYTLPPDLPVPQDDGACDHLARMRLPEIELTSTEGKLWNLAKHAGKTIVYIYPATGVPGKDPIPDWDAIPGAPGCTLQSLGFGERYEQFKKMGYQVFGVSGQSAAEQIEFKQRTKLPFILLNDSNFILRDKLGLPTFQAYGQLFYKRLALILEDGKIRQVFYPVFPPDQCATKVLAWLESNE